MEKYNKSNTQYQYQNLFLSVFSMAAFTVYLLKENKHPYRKVATDRYGRTVATVYLEDGRELNLEILKAGFGWHYKRYSKRQDYADA